MQYAFLGLFVFFLFMFLAWASNVMDALGVINNSLKEIAEKLEKEEEDVISDKDEDEFFYG